MTAKQASARAPLFDSIRGVAMILMAIYHFCFDLDHFGVISQNMNFHDGWLTFRAVIMTLFTGLVGVGLALAAVRYSSRGFLKRQLRVGICALIITIYTYFLFPNSWVYFGVLHFIFAASLLGPVLVRVPWLSLAAGIFMIALPFFYRDPVFTDGVLGLTGLSSTKPMTEDYAPIFPWLGTLLVGVFIGHIYRDAESKSAIGTGARSGRLEFAPLTRLGEHSLVFYMLHQVVLFPIAWVISKI